MKSALFTYDKENRMTIQNSDDDLTTNTYDGDGLRRSTILVDAKDPTTFVWDGTDYLGDI